MGVSNNDNTYRLGDAIVLVLKHRPYVDLSVPPSSNDYQDATCATLSIFDPTHKEVMLLGTEMTRIPNRPGWYFYRFQTSADMLAGVYTVIFQTQTTIDNQSYTNQNVQEFILERSRII